MRFHIHLLTWLLIAGCVSQAEKKQAGSPDTIQQAKPNTMSTIDVSSSAFSNRGSIPSKYSCDGENVNPPLSFKGIPKEARTLALVVDDPDAPGGTWVHWVMWNIPPVQGIDENSIPGMEGMNDFRKRHYGGPCPPSGVHRYFFKIFALDAELRLPESATKSDLEAAMKDHILAKGELIGLYKRNK